LFYVSFLLFAIGDKSQSYLEVVRVLPVYSQLTFLNSKRPKKITRMHHARTS